MKHIVYRIQTRLLKYFFEFTKLQVEAHESAHRIRDGPLAAERLCRYDVQGSVHRKYILIYIQQDATLHSLFISENCSTCFGWYLHPSSGAHTTVSTASCWIYIRILCRYIDALIVNFSSIHKLPCRGNHFIEFNCGSLLCHK